MSDQLSVLHDIPALIYTALWPTKIDGRFQNAMRGINLRLLVNFIDFPPAAFINIHDGDFTVTAIKDPTNIQVDMKVEGSYAALVSSALKSVFTRKIRIYGGRHIRKLLRLFNKKWTTTFFEVNKT